MTMAKRGRKASTDKAERGRWERIMFSVMGPPQVGDINAPIRDLPPRPVELCGTCGQPYEEHTIVRDPGLTYSRCPVPRG